MLKLDYRATGRGTVWQPPHRRGYRPPRRPASWTGQAKLRDQTIISVAYDGGTGNPVPADIPNVGYIDELGLTSYATFTTPATNIPTADDPLGKYNLNLTRFTLAVNAIGNLCDVPGFWIPVISAVDTQYRGKTQAKYAGGFTFQTAASSGLTASTAFTNIEMGHIPLGLKLDNLPYPIGLFQTALQNLSFRAYSRFSPLIGAAAGNPGNGTYYKPGTSSPFTSVSGQLTMNESYFDPIADPQSQPYLGFIHRWSEWQVALTGSGDLAIPLPGQNYYTRIGIMIAAGASGSIAPTNAALTRARLVYGTNIAPFDYDESHSEFTHRMRSNYGGLMDSWPTGFYLFDFIQRTHDNRDWINAAATTNLRLILSLASTVTYASGSLVSVCVEEVAPLTVPSAATVQGNAAVPALG